MAESDRREQDYASTLRDRLTRLSEASLHINESLDLDVVLQGVLDSARSLTDASYAQITTAVPAVEAATAGSHHPAAASPKDVKGRHSVLIVDDDPHTLRYVRQTLDDAGYAPVVIAEPTQPGAAGPDAPGNGRHRSDEGHLRYCGRGRDLPLRLRTGPGDRASLRDGRLRLHPRTILADRACGQDRGGPAQAHGSFVSNSATMGPISPTSSPSRESDTAWRMPANQDATANRSVPATGCA